MNKYEGKDNYGRLLNCIENTQKEHRGKIVGVNGSVKEENDKKLVWF